MEKYSIISLTLVSFAFFYALLIMYNYLSNYVVIEPAFTASAYHPNGFYDYYDKKCDTRCLTVPVTVDDMDLRVKFSDNYNAKLLLALMGFQHVTDQDVSNNPYILNNKTVIVLHNEYVTQKEYDAIVKQHTINFYPNALYALVDYHNNTITLVGDKTHTHNYFNWTEDNSNKERTSEGKPNYCTNQTFIKEDNDYVLNCWTQSPLDIIKYILEIRNLQ